jgi:ribosome-associated protein
MIRDHDPQHDEFDPALEPPSKSARKRAAHAAQDLGERLVGLRETELAALPLPERLLDAIRLARRITARGGLARQRQYIGKLMREIDTAPIEAALAAREGIGVQESELFRRLEGWRARLIAEGEPALDALAASHPGLDRGRVATLLARARGASGDTDRASSARALFRELRRQFEAAGAATPRAPGADEA